MQNPLKKVKMCIRDRYISRLASAKLPREGVRTVQVKPGNVTPEALSFLPSFLQKNPHAVQAMLTEGFASILSARLNVPMLPSSIGHAGGVMLSLIHI